MNTLLDSAHGSWGKPTAATVNHESQSLKCAVVARQPTHFRPARNIFLFGCRCSVLMRYSSCNKNVNKQWMRLLSSLHFWQMNQPFWITSPCLHWQWIKNNLRKRLVRWRTITLCRLVSCVSCICTPLPARGYQRDDCDFFFSLRFHVETLSETEFDCTFTDFSDIQTGLLTKWGCLLHNF